MVQTLGEAPTRTATVRVEIRPDRHMGWLATVAMDGEPTALLGRSKLPALMRALAFLVERQVEFAEPR
jgi:hypothetical protein